MPRPTYPAVATEPGIQRQVLAEAPEMMVVAFTFEAGAKGSLHDHPHLQSSFVASGRFRFTRGDEELDLSAGDTLIVPSGIRHGSVCIEAGQLIDVFVPRRDDFL